MNIGIDLINLRSLDEGTGRYARQLLQALDSIDDIDECSLFVNQVISDQITVTGVKFRTVVVPVGRKRVFPANQLYFARNRNWRRLDLLHSPVSVAPLLAPAKTVLTVHDLAYEVFPAHYSRKAILYWRIALRKACKNASRVIADSECTKKDLMTYMNMPGDNIRVVYPFVSASYKEEPASTAFPAAAAAAVASMRERYRLPDRYLLHVGVPHPRKNLINLVKAFRIAVNKGDFPHKLVLAGPQGWAIEAVRAEIETLGLEDDVVWTGVIAEEELPMVYRCSDALVFPSFYEGFGYPPLEAMACGVPVVVSGVSSIPEVVGQAGLYVDPQDPDDISEKILQILLDSELRSRLSKMSLERARQFSLQAMTSGIRQVYREVLAG